MLQKIMLLLMTACLMPAFMCAQLNELTIKPAALMTFESDASTINDTSNQLVVPDSIKKSSNTPPTDYFGMSWWQWLVVAISLALLLYIYRQPQLLQAIAKTIAISPIDKLLKRSQQLAHSGAKQKNTNSLYYELSGILISACEIASNSKLKHCTTNEALEKIRINGSLPTGIMEEAEDLLKICDNAKFAFQIPNAGEQKRTLERTVQLLQALKYLLHDRAQSAAE